MVDLGSAVLGAAMLYLAAQLARVAFRQFLEDRSEKFTELMKGLVDLRQISEDSDRANRGARPMIRFKDP